MMPTSLMTPPPVARRTFLTPRSITARRGTPLLSHDWEPMLDVCGNCRRKAPNHHERVCAKCGASMLVGELITNQKPLRVAIRCSACAGNAVRKLSEADSVGISAAYRVIPCEACCGIGWLGIDPHLPTDLKAGNEAKVIVLAARYVAGLPLWNAGDRDDRPEAKVVGPIKPNVEDQEFIGSLNAEESDFEECEEFLCVA